MKFNDSKLKKTCYLKEQLFKSFKKEIVFVGYSNVGKSSIINKILNRKKLARVSKTPGKTVSINFYDVGNFYFVDFPGYGFAKVDETKKINWSVLAQEYFSSKREILMAVLVLDARRKVKNLDLDMSNFLIEKDIFFIVVLNKVDKLKKSEIENLSYEAKKSFRLVENLEIVLFSTKTGQGVEKLKKIIEKLDKKN